MKVGSRFLVKVYRAVPMIDNPEVSCGFMLEEVEEVWVVKRFTENLVLGWNPERMEAGEFKRSEILELEE